MYQKTYCSPLGIIYMTSDGTYLTGLWFQGSRDDLKHVGTFEEQELPIFDETKRWLDMYFSGQNPDFIPKYKVANLTPFRKQVIDIMNTIPYGEVITYQDIAEAIAKERGLKKMSAQAVGGASVVDIYNFLPITKEYILSSVASNNIPRFKCLWNRFLLILKSFA